MSIELLIVIGNISIYKTYELKKIKIKKSASNSLFLILKKKKKKKLTTT